MKLVNQSLEKNAMLFDRLWGKKCDVSRLVTGKNRKFRQSFTIKNLQCALIGLTKIPRNSQELSVVSKSKILCKMVKLFELEPPVQDVLLITISKFWARISP